jgi:hypothetical protein
MQSNPTTRESILKQMRDSEEAASRLFEGLSAVQGNWKPQDGRGWSIWQCVEHLSLTNQVYAAALKEGLANAESSQKIATTGGITPGWFARFFISKVEPPVGIGVKTKPGATPGEKGDLKQALVRFAESHEALREIVMLWDSVDLNRVRYPNPFLPLVRFTVGTGLLIANAHDRRHLWQAQQVKLAASYPRE